MSRRSLLTTRPTSVVHTRFVLCIRRPSQLPFWTRGGFGSIFDFFTSRTPSAQLWHLFREATRHLLLLYSSRLSLSSYHRGCSREVFGPGDGVLAECLQSLATRCALCLSWFSKSETLDSRFTAPVAVARAYHWHLSANPTSVRNN